MTTMSAKLKLSCENMLVEAEKRHRGGGGAGGGGGGGGGGIRVNSSDQAAAEGTKAGGTRDFDAFPI